MAFTKVQNITGGNPQNPGASNTATGESGFAFDTTNKSLKVFDGSSLYEVTMPVSQSALVSATAATLTVTAALHANRTIVLNRGAGVAVQLPLATGTGNKYRFVVGTASDANVISAVVATDDFYGGYFQNDSGGSAAVTADFMEAASTSNTYSPTTLGGGGLVGDWIEVEDIATATWALSGVNKGVIDPTTRFSAV